MQIENAKTAVVQWVKAYLSSAYARGVEDLLTCTPFSAQEIQAALQQLIAESEVEALEPVGVTRSTSAPSAFHPATHFRVIRETDTAYRWQLQVAEKMVPANDWLKNRFIAKISDKFYESGAWLGVKLPVGI